MKEAESEPKPTGLNLDYSDKLCRVCMVMMTAVILGNQAL